MLLILVLKVDWMEDVEIILHYLFQELQIRMLVNPIELIVPRSLLKDLLGRPPLQLQR